MKSQLLSLILLNIIFMEEITAQSEATASSMLVQQDFNSLENWKALTFPKIKEHSTYNIIKLDSENSALECVSKNSASGLMYKKTFNVNKYPYLSWKWKVENVYAGVDELQKGGDDYPLRIYVIFKYKEDEAGFFEKTKYEALKLVYGDYPPIAALNYVWASSKNLPEHFLSPFSERVAILPFDSGATNLGSFQTHSTNMREDYFRIFKNNPPIEASLAIMSDSDNSGSSAKSYIDYLRISSQKIAD